MGANQRHSGFRIFLIVFTCFLFGATMFINYLATGDLGKDLGIYESNTGDISDYFYLEITPASWTFTIWAFIYVWQITWLVYGLSTICRKSESGTYIYQLPVMPSVIYFIYILNLCTNVAWIILFDRKFINICLALIILMALTLYIIIAISSWKARKHQDSLNKDGAGKEVWFIRFFLQNGIAFYATWVTVATHLNVAMIMHYTGGVANDISCTTALGILLFVTILWFLTETILLDAFTRYLFSPYIVLIVALSGSLAKNYDLELRYRNSILSIIILGMAILFLLLKIIILLVRHFRVPSLAKSYSPTTSEKSLKLES